ncbi:MAG: SH3 domain-containing protein [Cyanobacteria bacterium]|nr:SH3 domain-containing protein [Cyanobacteriota bacterium]
MDFLANQHLWLLYESPTPDAQPRHKTLWLGKSLSLGTLALGLLMGLPAGADSSSQTTYIAPPPGYNVNIRTGPGTQYPAVNTLQSGTAITLTGRYENGWAELTSGNWVAGNLIGATATGEEQASNTIYQAAIAPPPGYNVNIRSGPGTQYPAVNTLRPGTAITLTGRYENGWAELTDGNWVAGNLVRVGAATTTVITNPTVPVTPTTSAAPTQSTSGQSEIIALQNRLQALGYLPVRFVPNGVIEDTTTQAIRDFQQVHGLPIDGVAGHQTLAVLYSASARYKTSGTAPNPTTVSPSPNPSPTPTASATPSPTASPSPSPTGTTSPAPTASPSPSPPETAVPDLDPPTGAREVQVKTDNGSEIPIFAGPGTEYDLVGFLEDGATVTITGKIEGNWAEMSDGNWAYAPWLAL